MLRFGTAAGKRRVLGPDPGELCDSRRRRELRMSADPQILTEVPLFQGLDEAERAALAARVDAIRAPAGKLLFNYGDPGESLYIVKVGEVELFSKNDTGERIVLEIARPGDFFGEISLLDGGPRSASALVTKDLEAVVVDRGDLEALLQIHPAAAMDLLAAVGRRVRESAKLLRRTVSRDVNLVVADERTVVMKIADWISEFSGSLPFLFILSQTRQVARDRLRNDVEYQVNLKAELEIAHLHEKFEHHNAEVLERLAALERALGGGARPTSR
jgi:CRP-like cAMP-binding protein